MLIEKPTSIDNSTMRDRTKNSYDFSVIGIIWSHDLLDNSMCAAGDGAAIFIAN